MVDFGKSDKMIKISGKVDKPSGLLTFSLIFILYIYIYIYMHACVCACVWIWKNTRSPEGDLYKVWTNCQC